MPCGWEFEEGWIEAHVLWLPDDQDDDGDGDPLKSNLFSPDLLMILAIATIIS